MSVARRTVLRGLGCAGLTLVTPLPLMAQTFLKTAIRAEEIGGILQNFYRAPIPPDQIVAVIQQVITQGIAETRAKRLSLIAFMAGLIAVDATYLDRLAPVFAKLPGDTPHRLIRAVLYAGREDWAAQLDRLKTLWPDKTADIDRLAANGARAIPTLKRDGQPEVIDMNWAFFGATGRRDAVMAVIEALGDLRASDPDKVAVAHAARLTLATQSIEHDAVFEICQRAQWGSYGDHLRLVVIAAQHRDISRFKADADAAIRAASEGKPVPVPTDIQAATVRTTTPRR